MALARPTRVHSFAFPLRLGCCMVGRSGRGAPGAACVFSRRLCARPSPHSRVPLPAAPAAPAPAATPTTTVEADESGGGYTVSDAVVDGQVKKVSRRTAWFVKKNIKGSTKKLNHIARQVGGPPHAGLRPCAAA